MWKSLKTGILIALLGIMVGTPAATQQSIPHGMFAMDTIRKLVSNGQFVGTMTATNNPTSWSITVFSPAGVNGFFAIDNSGNITVTSTGATNLTGATGTATLTVQACNSFGCGNGTATINYAPAPFVWNAAASNPNGFRVGMNIAEGILYYNNFVFFADITRQINSNFGGWDNGSNSAQAPTDATGAPTSCTGACIGGFPANYPSGVYSLTWQGTGNVALNAGTRSAVTVTNPGPNQLNSATWTYTQNTANNAAVQLQATPPVTNIHLIAPSNLTTGTCYGNPCFMTLALQKLSPFNPIRFMAALNENNQTLGGVFLGDNVKDWANRAWPPGTSGVANMGHGNSGGNLSTGLVYEDMIAFANTTGKDVWVNVPVIASDNYVCRLARLFRFGESGAGDNGSNCSLTAAATAPFSSPPLNSTSHLYVEYANEEWNDAYPARQQAMCFFNGVGENGNTCVTFAGQQWLGTSSSAILNAAMANSSLPWSNFTPKNTTNFGVIAQVLSVLNYRNKSIFSKIWAISPAGPAGQIRVVYNTQGGCGSVPGCVNNTLTPSISFLNSYVPTVQGSGNYTAAIDYVVVAPYISIGSCTSTGAACTAALNTATQSGGNAFLSIQGDLQSANAVSLPLVAYEGGDNMTDNAAGNVPAWSDPGMFTAMHNYVVTAWGSQVGKVNSLTFCCSVSNGGPATGSHPWVSLSQITDPGSQVYDGLISATLLPGDVNADGVVNQADCTIVKNNLGLNGAFWMQGDLNHDGNVGADDEAIVNANLPAGNGTCP